jgi:hypothetical protein
MSGGSTTGATTGPPRAVAIAAAAGMPRGVPATVTITVTTMSRPSSRHAVKVAPFAVTNVRAAEHAGPVPSIACDAPASAPRSAAACARWRASMALVA